MRLVIFVLVITLELPKPVEPATVVAANPLELVQAVSDCVPPGGLDDTLNVTSCCNGRAVPGSTRCARPEDYDTTWQSCVQTCE